jgi:hypothetical protein
MSKLRQIGSVTAYNFRQWYRIRAYRHVCTRVYPVLSAVDKL